MRTAIDIRLPPEEIRRRSGPLEACGRFENDRLPVFLFLDFPFTCSLAG